METTDPRVEGLQDFAQNHGILIVSQSFNHAGSVSIYTTTKMSKGLDIREADAVKYSLTAGPRLVILLKQREEKQKCVME